MARPRISDQSKLNRGTLRPNRVNRLAPSHEPFDVIPPPPAEYPALEATTWLRIAAHLGPSRIVGASDLEAFRLMVRAVALATRTATDRKASAATKCRTHATAMAALASFGMTPASRSRATVAPAKKTVDPIDEFLPPWTMPQA
jgi:hypothetical protein